jgi:radical S-adenosyl methionine domain-containing protein 2
MKDQTISAVNYHLNRNCNMHCKFCFATFRDLDKVSYLLQEHLKIIEACAGAGIKKMNFAGGEPTLVKHLPVLLQKSKELGMMTSIVTNGSLLLKESVWLSIYPWLDILGLSVDSVNNQLNVRSGRALNRSNQPLFERDYLKIVELARLRGIAIKLNTVVSGYNYQDNIVAFVREVNPFRWKIFQALPVEGQNDTYRSEYLITNADFSSYVNRHREGLPDLSIIAEDNELMTGSYLMIDPAGRLFDDTKGTHTYSRPILKVGFEEALRDVTASAGKFLERDGNYFTRLKYRVS